MSDSGLRCFRRMTQLAAVLALAALAGCGGHHGSLPADAEQAAPAAAVAVDPGQLSLPAPAELLRLRGISYTEADLQCYGSDFPLQLPHQQVTENAGLGSFNPHYTAASGLKNLAYAVYLFGGEGYNRQPTFTLLWAQQPANYANLWIGLANFAAQRWDWFAGDSGNVLTLPSLTPYIGPAAQGYPMYACVVLGGTQPASLAKLFYGMPSDVPDDAIYIVPSRLRAAAGQVVTLTVCANKTAQPLRSLLGARVAFDQGSPGQENEYVSKSADWGTPGQTGPYDADGVWAGMSEHLIFFQWLHYFEIGAILSYYTPFEYWFEPQQLPGAMLAVDLGGRPSRADASGNSTEEDDPLDPLVEATGALYNFQIVVRSDTHFELQRMQEGEIYTSYGVPWGVQYIWANDTNAGQPGVELNGETLPTARLSVSPASGEIPLTVQFNLSNSYELPGHSIIKYEIDYGDGIYHVVSGPAGLVHTYWIQGLYSVKLRATDEVGYQSIAEAPVCAGATYDEVENNDGDNSNADLITIPVVGFHGSFGPDPSGTYIPYDGDFDDRFAFNGVAGKEVFFRRRLGAGIYPILELWDQNGAMLQPFHALPYGDDGTRWTLPATGVYTLLLRDGYEDPNSHGDYLLDGCFDAPTARLRALPDRGALPLTVTLDASTSTDIAPGYITSYEFDPEGVSEFQPPQIAPTLVYTCTIDGVYHPQVRVTDNEGNRHTTWAWIFAGMTMYDEQEDNDTPAQANPLPAFPFSGWRGSIGGAENYRGYDCDTDDWFSFTAAPGDRLDLRVWWEESIKYAAFYEVVGAEGTVLGYDMGTEVGERLYDIPPDAVAPFYLHVTGGKEYFVDGSLGTS